MSLTWFQIFFVSKVTFCLPPPPYPLIFPTFFILTTSLFHLFVFVRVQLIKMGLKLMKICREAYVTTCEEIIW